MAEIQGYKVLIDRVDEHLLTKHRWWVSGSSSSSPRVTRQTGCAPNTKNIYLYQEIMGFPEGKWIDHINGDTMDNRRVNLRVCSPQQNSFNRRPRKNKKVPYKGVTSRGKKFLALISHEGKRYRIGLFQTAEDAATAYDHMAKKYFGEYAWLNTVHGDLNKEQKVCDHVPQF